MENSKEKPKEFKGQLDQNLEKVKKLASYCYNCGKCLSVCPTNLLGIFSPKGFIHKYVKESDEDIDSLDNFLKQQNLFNCLTCEQCGIYCPMVLENEGVIFSEIMHGIREYSFSKGLMDDELNFTKNHDDLMVLGPIIQSDVEHLT
ncbi:MAG: 4Fe-4S dicluster domain-containing protein, partial [archaeon]|nr:4Fe-4S dicluster domain-containing protein [archaeon]